ncbi:MAG: transcriptional regulator [Sphingomonas bacterium]|nr:transcriptional regulator [Sphingomonas bacterium]
MIEAALAGIALAYVWGNRVLPHLAEGRLIACMEDWIVPEDWLYIYYPTRKHMTAGLGAIVEMLRA